MSKAILILNHKPRMCVNCWLADLIENQGIVDNPKMICRAKRYYTYPSSIPDWCPLREMPKKDGESYYPDEYMDGYSDGWNACLDEILGE